MPRERAERPLDEGVKHHQAGRLDEALACYERVLAREPGNADALHLSGVIAASRGRYEVATARIEQALAHRPNEPAFHSNLGHAFLEQGRLAKAIEAYRKALQLRPGDAEFTRNLDRACKKRYAEAVASYRDKKFEDADAACQQVLIASPEHAEAWHLAGLAAKARGDLAGAKGRLERAVAIAPGEAAYHNNLGTLLSELGQPAQAVECYERAIRIDPNLIDAQVNRAMAQRTLGRVLPAIESFRQIIALDPTHVEAHFRIADLLRVTGRHDEAVVAARRAVELDPLDARTHGQLGIVLRSLDRTSEAIQACRRSIELNPDAAGTYNNLGQLLKDQARVAEAIASYRKSVSLNPANASVHSNLLFSLHYTEDHDARTIFEEHRRWARQHAASPASVQAAEVDRAPERRLRIGYVSADLKVHSVAFFLEPLLAARDRTNFEVFCYSNNLTGDATTARLRGMADGWRSIAALDDAHAYALVRADRIDILVDLSGHTKDNRLPLFARKPAPIQVTYLGYPDTTGLETIDYRFTDDRADPAGSSDAYYTEKLVRVPGGFLCYGAPESSPDVGPLPVLRKGRITFASFNNLAKISPTTIACWSEILRSVPESRLLLKCKALADEGTRDDFYDRFRRHGVDPGRIELAGWIKDRVDHMALYNEVDIGLDTFPYHGTTTTCEALWMGVPVVTLAGQTHVSRVGVSLLRAIGLDELIVGSSREYVRTAVELAGSASRLGSLRGTLRDRMRASPLTDAARIAQEIEAAYRAMWRRFCSA